MKPFKQMGKNNICKRRSHNTREMKSNAELTEHFFPPLLPPPFLVYLSVCVCYTLCMFWTFYFYYVPFYFYFVPVLNEMLSVCLPDKKYVQ